MPLRDGIVHGTSLLLIRTGFLTTLATLLFARLLLFLSGNIIDNEHSHTLFSFLILLLGVDFEITTSILNLFGKSGLFINEKINLLPLLIISLDKSGPAFTLGESNWKSIEEPINIINHDALIDTLSNLIRFRSNIVTSENGMILGYLTKQNEKPVTVGVLLHDKFGGPKHATSKRFINLRMKCNQCIMYQLRQNFSRRDVRTDFDVQTHHFIGAKELLGTNSIEKIYGDNGVFVGRQDILVPNAGLVQLLLTVDNSLSFFKADHISIRVDFYHLYSFNY